MRLNCEFCDGLHLAASGVSLFTNVTQLLLLGCPLQAAEEAIHQPHQQRQQNTKHLAKHAGEAAPSSQDKPGAEAAEVVEQTASI